jgi:hypothetical protein
VAPHVHLHVEHAHTYLTNRQGLFTILLIYWSSQNL